MEAFFIWEWIITWFVSALIMAGACAWLASQRGRDKVTWGLLGFLIGLIALILLAVAPSKKVKDETVSGKE